MASSISQQLEDLLNPLPKFADPEDDQEEDTKAKLIENFDEGEDDDDSAAVGKLRLQASSLLLETDRRYLGKATSRKQLRRDSDDSGDEEEDDEEDGIEDQVQRDEDGGLSDGDGSEEGSTGSDEDTGARMKTLVKKMEAADIALPVGTDLFKLTEGMDDLGESEEEGAGETEEEDGDSEEEDEDGSEEDEGDEEETMQDDADGAVQTFSNEKVSDEVEKGKAVKNQLALWDQLLEGRIKLQKALLTANALPQPLTFPEFKRRGGAEFSGALKNSHKALKALQRSLLELQDLLLCQTPDTRAIVRGQAEGALSDDEEVKSDEEEGEDQDQDQEAKKPPKRKLEMSEYPEFMAKRFAAFQPYRNATLQKWHDKTRLSMGKMGKGFAAFDRNILTQVEQVLMDKERLLRRTQTKRSEYRILGQAEPLASDPAAARAEEQEEVVLKTNAHLKDLDEEIFDDDDFYHQLLRELIERKTSVADPNDQVAMGRQWLAIQKLRSKIKRKVDTKASKGRKVRFHVHSKLLNFMAPIDHSSMSDDARTELFRSLFGKNSTLDEIPRD
ncbi:hypothetical protein GJAV_G00129840 [Gymnothorax javanicus]|nr:hypothetical protein GJAV_G00129840 [Gymnothorax javanicus]